MTLSSSTFVPAFDLQISITWTSRLKQPSDIIFLMGGASQIMLTSLQNSHIVQNSDVMLSISWPLVAFAAQSYSVVNLPGLVALFVTCIFVSIVIHVARNNKYVWVKKPTVYLPPATFPYISTQYYAQI